MSLRNCQQARELAQRWTLARLPRGDCRPCRSRDRRVLRTNGMTLQKIAATVGVSLKTAHRAASDLSFDNSEIINERGQLRPMHYAARAVDTLGSKLRPTLDAI